MVRNMRDDEKWLCTFEVSSLGDIIDVQFLSQDYNSIRKSQAALSKKIKTGEVPVRSVVIILRSDVGMRAFVIKNATLNMMVNC
nr:MAG TPA: hypothetical protein [Caudoviricetes sp.]